MHIYWRQTLKLLSFHKQIEIEIEPYSIVINIIISHTQYILKTKWKLASCSARQRLTSIPPTKSTYISIIRVRTRKSFYRKRISLQQIYLKPKSIFCIQTKNTFQLLLWKKKQLINFVWRECNKRTAPKIEWYNEKGIFVLNREFNLIGMPVARRPSCTHALNARITIIIIIIRW